MMTLSTTPLHSTESEHLYAQVLSCIDSNRFESLAELLIGANPVMLPAVLRQLTEEERVIAWEMLTVFSPETAANLLDHYSDSEMCALVQHLPIELVQHLFQYLRSPDRRLLINHFPAEYQEQLKSAFPDAWRKEERAALVYSHDSIGGICKSEILKLSQNGTVSELSNLLVNEEQNYEFQEWRYVYLHDEYGSYLGAIKLKDLFSLPYGSKLKNYIDTTVPTADPEMDIYALKSILDTTSHPVVPVVDSNGFQIGIVGFKQLNEALYEKSKQQMLEQSGVFGGDEFRTMPTMKRNIRRLTFLLPSVMLSYAAVSIIAQFESVIAQFALLAAILPLVANLSGAAGNQAVAVSIRELSMGSLTPKDVLFVIAKELPIGVVNGVFIGSILALLSYLTHGNEHAALPLLVGVAYVISSTMAVIIGGSLPLILKRMNLDPAMLSSPVLTTLTDAIAFFSVLYMAQAFLL